MTAMHGPILTLPSNLSGDYITRDRQALLMSLYSVGPLNVDQNQYVDDWYKGFKGTGEGTPFSECIKKNRSQKCLDDLISSGVIPSFESFAKEVDLYLENGFKAHCLNARYFNKQK